MNTSDWLMEFGCDLTGKRAVITGATGSLGASTARMLSSLGASIVLVARDAARANALAKELKSACATDVSVELCDMASRENVLALAKRLMQSLDKIDLLIHIAGIYRQKREITQDGLEKTFMVNYAAPVLLTRALLPLVESAPDPKIIAMTSLSGYYARIDMGDLMALRAKSLTDVYARSKRLLCYGMAKISRETDARVILVHPGVSATNLFSLENAAYSQRFLRFAVPIMRRIFMLPNKAALCAVYASCQALPTLSLAAPKGLCQAWGYPKAMRLPKAFLDEKTAQKIWEKTAGLLA